MKQVARHNNTRHTVRLPAGRRGNYGRPQQTLPWASNGRSAPKAAQGPHQVVVSEASNWDGLEEPSNERSVIGVAIETSRFLSIRLSRNHRDLKSSVFPHTSVTSSDRSGPRTPNKCPGWGSNPHDLRRQILSLLRLPIPPPGQGGVIRCQGIPGGKSSMGGFRGR